MHLTTQNPRLQTQTEVFRYLSAGVFMNALDTFCFPSTNHLMGPYSHLFTVAKGTDSHKKQKTKKHPSNLFLSVPNKYSCWRCLVSYYIDNVLLIECADECLVNALWRAGMATTVLTHDQLLHTLDHLSYSSPAQLVLVGPLAWITSIIKQVGCVASVWQMCSKVISSLPSP